VILYADRETKSMRQTLDETNRRRVIQRAYNEEHGITPTTIVKRIADIGESIWEQDYVTVPKSASNEPAIPPHELPALIDGLRREMRAAAKEMAFERAADLRDQIRDLEAELLKVG